MGSLGEDTPTVLRELGAMQPAMSVLVGAYDAHDLRAPLRICVAHTGGPNLAR